MRYLGCRSNTITHKVDLPSYTVTALWIGCKFETEICANSCPTKTGRSNICMIGKTRHLINISGRSLPRPPGPTLLPEPIQRLGPEDHHATRTVSALIPHITYRGMRPHLAAVLKSLLHHHNTGGNNMDILPSSPKHEFQVQFQR